LPILDNDVTAPDPSDLLVLLKSPDDPLQPIGDRHGVVVDI
jgi:hypothetical protein